MAETYAGHRPPPNLEEIKGQWAGQLSQLQAQYGDAKKQTQHEGRRSGAEGNTSTPEQIQFRLQELKAAKAHNDFLESGRQYEKLATDASRRLQNPNLSLFERHQIETTRDQMQALAGEFQLFLTERGARPLHVPPVQTASEIHFVDGSKQWNDKPLGRLAAFWDQSKEVLGGTKQALMKGPFTPEENYQICKLALGNLISMGAGKLMPAPGHPYAAPLYDEAMGRAVDAGDPAGATCRLIYPQRRNQDDLFGLGAMQTVDDPVHGRVNVVEVDKARLTEAMVASLMADPDIQARWTPEQMQALQQVAQAQARGSDGPVVADPQRQAPAADRAQPGATPQPFAEQDAVAQRFKEQLGTRLAQMGLNGQQIETLAAVASREAAQHAGQGAVSEFLLKKDGSGIALKQASAPLQEFSVQEALGRGEPAHGKPTQIAANESPVVAQAQRARTA